MVVEIPVKADRLSPVATDPTPNWTQRPHSTSVARQIRPRLCSTRKPPSKRPERYGGAPRGRFGGPFQILIRAPEVCRHLQRLGEYLRWGSSLPPALSELAICLTARHLRVDLEWHAHAPLAVEAGVPAAAIGAIRTGATPSFAAADQILVHRVITELIASRGFELPWQSDTKRLSAPPLPRRSPGSASKGSSNLAQSSAITPRSETR
jgi:hypothetical protein